MKPKLPPIKALSYMLMSLKKMIHDDYRAFEDDDRPGMQVTCGFDIETGEWDFQTGDNSYSGPAYFYDVWGVGYLYRNSNCREIAKEILADAESCIYLEN